MFISHSLLQKGFSSSFAAQAFYFFLGKKGVVTKKSKVGLHRDRKYLAFQAAIWNKMTSFMSLESLKFSQPAKSSHNKKNCYVITRYVK